MPHSESSPPASWVRPALGAALATAAAVLVGALVVAYHNVRYSYARVVDIFGRVEGADAGSVDLAAAVVPDWVAPFMQDLSVVSPALIAFTAARMAFACGLLLRDPDRTRRWGAIHFPFPDPYKVYFIQMGLLGTIVGFVLAFAEVDPRAERQSLILLEALGTALWSTLTAILLSYVLCPVFEAFLQKAQAQLTSPAPRNTRSALDMLRERTVAASESLEGLRRSTQEIVAESSALADEIHGRRVLGRVADLEAVTERVAAAVGEIDEHQRVLGFRLDKLEATANATGERWSALDSTLARQRADIDRLLAGLEQIPRLDARTDEQRQRADEIGKDLVAAKTRIDELQAVTGSLRNDADLARRDRGRIDSLERWIRGLQPFRSPEDPESDV